MKIKNFILVIAILVAMTSCETNEDKANKLIKQDLFESLNDFDSYEPVKTTIDTLKANNYGDTLMLQYFLGIKAAETLIDKERAEFEDAKHQMDIWNGGYYSDYKAKMYREAYDKAFEIMAKGDIYINILNETNDSIKARSKVLNGQQYGWLVTHKFRCKTKGGQSTLAEFVYYIDKDFTRIIRQFDTQDYTVEDIKETIDKSLNTTSKMELSDF